MKSLFAEAKKFIAGGVNSPVRAFKSVGCEPVFVRKAKGKYLFGEDGKRYLDFCMSWGPLILGHAHPSVVKTIRNIVLQGASFGAPTIHETELARLICRCMPSIERIRFVNSGTEAAMSAIRLARGFTGKKKILKFDGCYHGHSDCFLVKAGSGVSYLSGSSSLGVPKDLVRHTISIPFNDISFFEKTVRQHKSDLAAVILEPVPGNMGVVLPEKGFLRELCEITQCFGIILIFDEVITGFRIGLGGAQEYYRVRPDITVLGKIIGGGIPVGAFGGKKEIMDLLAPTGGVYQAGTLSGNPVAMAAGLATLSFLRNNKKVYEQMAKIVTKFADQWRENSKFTVSHVGSMFTIFFTDKPVHDQRDALSQNPILFRQQYREWLNHGIYMPPSMFETAFVSIEHAENDMEKLL